MVARLVARSVGVAGREEYIKAFGDAENEDKRSAAFVVDGDAALGKCL